MKFKLPIPIEKEIIFRKFITERLKRATARIKIPKNKNVSIFGEIIHIVSKSYKGNVRFFFRKRNCKIIPIKFPFD